MKVAGEDRFAAVEDAARLRDALGVSLPRGLPGVFTEATDRPLETLVARYARTHGPFTAVDVGARLGASTERVRTRPGNPRGRGPRPGGRVPPGGVGPRVVDADVLRRLRQRSLAALRKEVEPVEAATLGRFLPAWQGADRPSGASDALVETIARLQGAAIPASILETDVLPARVRGYRPADLDALCASGDLVWLGAEPLGADDGRVVLCFREQVRALRDRREPPSDPPEGELHDAIRAHLARSAEPRSGRISWWRPAPPTNAPCCARSGTWCGRAR